MEARTIIDTQYTVHAAYDAANHATDNSSHGTSIVLTDASPVGSAIRYALCVCSCGHHDCRGARKYDVSNHVYL
jgi:hypothetical protein